MPPSSSAKRLMRNPLNFQIVRFLLVGVMNTAFSYSTYCLLLFVGFSYVVSYTASFVLGLLFSFVTQGRLVFGNGDKRLFPRYVACWCLVFGANLLLISVFVRAGVTAYVAGALALVPSVALGYLLQRFIVFGAVRPKAPQP
jgi:putative flippase GtrA